MGVTGPIPKRSDQLIRRNVDDTPVTKISTIGPVEVGDLNIPDAHPLVVDLYNSMKDSAQSRYYEPSDWAYARLTFYVLNEMLTQKTDEGKKVPVGAMKLTAVNQMLTSLLLTEGDRRRVRIEVERNQDGGDAQVLQVADLFRERLNQARQ